MLWLSVPSMFLPLHISHISGAQALGDNQLADQDDFYLEFYLFQHVYFVSLLVLSHHLFMP